MRCVKCGQDTGEAAQACVLCGAPVARRSSPASAPGGPGSAIGQQILPGASAPQQAKSARRRALIGTSAGLVVLVAVIAAVALPRALSGVQRSLSGGRRSPSGVQSSAPAAQVMYQYLQAGMCLTGLDVSQSLTTGSQWPEYVTVAPCTHPHIAEVFFAHNLWPQSRKAYPGDNAINNRATARCAKAFRAYDGIASTASEFDTTDIAPDAATWLPGDRFVVCVAYMPGTSPVKYSIKGSRR